MRRVPMTKHSVVMSGCNTLWLRRVDGPIGGGVSIVWPLFGCGGWLATCTEVVRV